MNLSKLLQRTLAAGVLASCLATSVSAIQYDATAAVDGGGHDHVVWIPGVFTQNEFMPTGSFVENYGAGTASLTGTALKDGNGFIINAQFSGYVPNSIPDSIADAPAGSPKVEEDGSDKGNWWYYTSTSGTLTGVGSFAGTNYVIERAGPAFQVGYGASGKNSDFGASGWLEIYHMNDLGGKGDYFKKGDFNLDLERVPDEGATILLFGGALGLFFMIRRRLS